VRTAKDIMTVDVATIAATALISEAIALMKQRGIHALIVAPSGNESTYGIVTEADIAYKVIAPGYDPQELIVKNFMTHPCITIEPDMTVDNIARLFARHHIHRAPVVQDKLLGIVAASDILHKSQWW